MKKIIRYFLFFIAGVFAENTAGQTNLEVRMGRFTNGENASVSDLLQYPSMTLINRDADGNTKIVSYDCMSTSSNKSTAGATIKNESFLLNAATLAMIANALPGQEFIIKDIVIEVVNAKTGAIETVKMEPITLKIAAQSGGTSLGMVDYVGKLITGKNHDQPVTNQKVVLQNQAEAALQTTTTDSYGDFKFTALNADQSYKINVLVTDDTKIKGGQLYAAKPDGTVIKTFNKTQKGYVYELLPPELNTLAKEKEEDTELAIKNFGASKQAALTVIENIYYDPNSSDIKPESVEKLDKIINAMAANKSLKLQINSHTDSKGEDAYNLTLSQKRAQKVMEYFILQGIEKERLKAKGFGETKILNRCKNGIDCSETEHQLNRRTEFDFTK
jgi:outer membrane protein OmpA-like peptidoglycan-associated protein